MPNIKSAKKRMRQNEKRRIYNKSIKSTVKTHVKKFLNMVEVGSIDEAKKFLPLVVSQLDKSGKKGIYHKNYIGRKKSTLFRKLNLATSALAE